MKKPHIRLTRAASEEVRHLDALKAAASAAFEAAGGGEIYFLSFRHGGRQYSLCSRHILEVDILPNRVPPKTLRYGAKTRR